MNSDLQVSLAQLQWVIILSSADPHLPLEPAVLAKLHYDPATIKSMHINKRFGYKLLPYT